MGLSMQSGKQNKIEAGEAYQIRKGSLTSWRNSTEEDPCKDKCPKRCYEKCGQRCDADGESDDCKACAVENKCLPCFKCHKEGPPDTSDGDKAGGRAGKKTSLMSFMNSTEEDPCKDKCPKRCYEKCGPRCDADGESDDCKA